MFRLVLKKKKRKREGPQISPGPSVSGFPFAHYLYRIFGFDPDLGSASQWLVWAIDHTPVADPDLVAFPILFVVFDCEHQTIPSVFGVCFDLVLVDVNPSTHVILRGDSWDPGVSGVPRCARIVLRWRPHAPSHSTVRGYAVPPVRLLCIGPLAAS